MSQARRSGRKRERAALQDRVARCKPTQVLARGGTLPLPLTMKVHFRIAVVILALAALAQADTQWGLTQSTITYHVSHPLHESEGVSHAAKGMGICHAGECNFLIAVPVKSFESGDSNRDLHMLQVTRGAEYPMVMVRTRLPESDENSASINADLQIQFAGQTAEFKQVPFKLEKQGNEIHLTGTIPATLSDFKISPPSLLTIPVKNEIPIRVDLTWRKQ